MEQCAECGFDVDDYTAHDLATARRWLTGMTSETTEHVDHDAYPDVADAIRAVGDAVLAIDETTPDPADVHLGVHRLRSLGRVIHSAGAGVASQVGAVAQVNLSGGGIPKTPVVLADVTRDGLVGDRQANRKHHGRPFQAVCLWSSEVIEALVAEGHPIHPGAAGENITVSGIDWSAIRPGANVLVGDALLQLSAWAVPCRKNDQWFTGRSDRILHTLHPGWSRVYAWVSDAGTVRTGDEVVVEP